MSEPPLIALVDCNNFYVSCERVFRPDLNYKPVAVLSNNDGCIVARSQEVKDLGIKMATPVHQVQHLINRHHIQLFSSNYTLYADMSYRVMQCLEAFTPKIEVYSIDESFLEIAAANNKDTTVYGQHIRQTTYRNTGIPVCVGIAPTKTLAKLANYAAKRWKQTHGVLDISDITRRNKLLKLVPVNEVWGIGRQTTKRLKLMGINTAYDLAIQPIESIQAQFNIVIARTVIELNGTPCLSIDDTPTDKQHIVCSRSFKHKITELHSLSDALASFCSRAAEKLRKQNSITGSITVFIRTNPFNPNEPQYQRSISIHLDNATSDTRQIITTAKRLLTNIYKVGYRYQHCGVQLGNIKPVLVLTQSDIFDLASISNSKSVKLMQTIDSINHRFPQGISVSPTKINNNWEYQVEHLSKRYTTNWNELVVARCS